MSISARESRQSIILSAAGSWLSERWSRRNVIATLLVGFLTFAVTVPVFVFDNWNHEIGTRAYGVTESGVAQYLKFPPSTSLRSQWKFPKHSKSAYKLAKLQTFRFKTCTRLSTSIERNSSLALHTQGAC